MASSSLGVEVLPFERRDAAVQLERSEAMLFRVSRDAHGALLRWYGYTAPALVLGVAGRPDLPTELRCRSAGVALLQRRSGGGAVYVDRDALALDVALPATHPLAAGDVVLAYRWLGEVFAGALGEPAGDSDALTLVSPERAHADQRAQRSAAPGTAGALRGLACFGTLSAYEVALCAGTDAPLRKLVGLSQVRRRGAVLYQAGLHATFPAAQLAALLCADPRESLRLAAELERRTADLHAMGRSDSGRLMESISHRAAGRITANA